MGKSKQTAESKQTADFAKPNIFPYPATLYYTTLAKLFILCCFFWTCSDDDELPLLDRLADGKNPKQILHTKSASENSLFHSCSQAEGGSVGGVSMTGCTFRCWGLTNGWLSAPRQKIQPLHGASPSSSSTFFPRVNMAIRNVGRNNLIGLRECRTV